MTSNSQSMQGGIFGRKAKLIPCLGATDLDGFTRFPLQSHTAMFDLVATEDDQRACAPPHGVQFVSETQCARYTGVEVPRPRARRALARAWPRAPVHQAGGRRGAEGPPDLQQFFDMVDANSSGTIDADGLCPTHEPSLTF